MNHERRRRVAGHRPHYRQGAVSVVPVMGNGSDALARTSDRRLPFTVTLFLSQMPGTHLCFMIPDSNATKNGLPLMQGDGRPMGLRLRWYTDRRLAATRTRGSGIAAYGVWS